MNRTEFSVDEVVDIQVCRLHDESLSIRIDDAEIHLLPPQLTIQNLRSALRAVASFVLEIDPCEEKHDKFKYPLPES